LGEPFPKPKLSGDLLAERSKASLLERRMKNLILLQKGKRKRRVKGGQESKCGTHLHHSFGSAQENIFSL
jgi:hypothetical protein